MRPRSCGPVTSGERDDRRRRRKRDLRRPQSLRLFLCASHALMAIDTNVRGADVHDDRRDRAATGSGQSHRRRSGSRCRLLHRRSRFRSDAVGCRRSVSRQSARGADAAHYALAARTATSRTRDVRSTRALGILPTAAATTSGSSIARSSRTISKRLTVGSPGFHSRQSHGMARRRFPAGSSHSSSATPTDILSS